MLSERTIIDQITFLEDGQIQVREATVILRDGVELTRTFHRRVIQPGDSLENESERVRLLAETDHTPEVIARFKAAQG